LTQYFRHVYIGFIFEHFKLCIDKTFKQEWHSSIVSLKKTNYKHKTLGTTAVIMRKRSERRKYWALAVVRRSQKFSPCRRPPPWGRRTAKI